MKQFYNDSPTHPVLTTPNMYAPSNEQAAWFALAYTAACLNGDISEESRETLCKLITSKELFRGHEMVDYFCELMEVKDEQDPKELIRQAAKKISPEQAPTLFCIVTETLLTKGYLTKKEEEILAFIGSHLHLDGYLTNKITEVLLIKNKGNCNYL